MYVYVIVCVAVDVTLTRYFESGHYTMFMSYMGKNLIGTVVEDKSYFYQVFTKQDVKQCAFQSK